MIRALSDPSTFCFHLSSSPTISTSVGVQECILLVENATLHCSDSSNFRLNSNSTVPYIVQIVSTFMKRLRKDSIGSSILSAKKKTGTNGEPMEKNP